MQTQVQKQPRQAAAPSTQVLLASHGLPHVTQATRSGRGNRKVRAGTSTSVRRAQLSRDVGWG